MQTALPRVCTRNLDGSSVTVKLCYIGSQGVHNSQKTIENTANTERYTVYAAFTLCKRGHRFQVCEQNAVRQAYKTTRVISSIHTSFRRVVRVLIWFLYSSSRWLACVELYILLLRSMLKFSDKTLLSPQSSSKILRRNSFGKFIGWCIILNFFFISKQIFIWIYKIPVFIII